MLDLMSLKKILFGIAVITAAGYSYLSGTLEVDALTSLYSDGATAIYETGAPLFCCAS